MINNRKLKSASWPVSRVLYGRTCVRRGSHSSWTDVAIRLLQPTRTTDPETDRLTFAKHAVPIRFCSRWGLPCRPCYQLRGGLLPHPFTLTPSFLVSHPFLDPAQRKTGRFPFCGTFPGVAPAGRYPAPCFHGARTFLTCRLSAYDMRGCPASWRPYKCLSSEKGKQKRPDIFRPPPILQNECDDQAPLK